jgi:hypothetical protein
MISAVPQPSAVSSTMFARQTCFCGLLRSATIAASRWRSLAVTSTVIPVRMPQTRTPQGAGESRWDSSVRAYPLVRALLTRAASDYIYDHGGSPGLYVSVPKWFSRQITVTPYELPRNELYRWMIPQLEYHDNIKRLPDAYSEILSFSKLSHTDEMELKKELSDERFGKRPQ